MIHGNCGSIGLSFHGDVTGREPFHKVPKTVFSSGNYEILQKELRRVAKFLKFDEDDLDFSVRTQFGDVKNPQMMMIEKTTQKVVMANFDPKDKVIEIGVFDKNLFVNPNIYLAKLGYTKFINSWIKNIPN